MHNIAPKQIKNERHKNVTGRKVYYKDIIKYLIFQSKNTQIIISDCVT